MQGGQPGAVLGGCTEPACGLAGRAGVEELPLLTSLLSPTVHIELLWRGELL